MSYCQSDLFKMGFSRGMIDEYLPAPELVPNRRNADRPVRVWNDADVQAVMQTDAVREILKEKRIAQAKRQWNRLQPLYGLTVNKLDLDVKTLVRWQKKQCDKGIEIERIVNYLIDMLISSCISWPEGADRILRTYDGMPSQLKRVLHAQQYYIIAALYPELKPYCGAIISEALRTIYTEVWVYCLKDLQSMLSVYAS